MNQPRVIIAGTQSGVGKTSISLALMKAFTAAGLKVQAFKVGPDYIDPSYHSVATGSPSYNLDSWLLKKETIEWLFQVKSKPADISIIEGVMGLYDGFESKKDNGSTAQIAKMLSAPVILVVNAQSIARSIAAMVKGYQIFDPEIRIEGVILNKVGSKRHADLLKESIEHYTGIPVVGALLRDKKIQIPERHLGLATAAENKGLKECLDSLANVDGLNLEKILNIAKNTSTLIPCTEPSIEETTVKTSDESGSYGKVRIGIAKDRAFSFYYPSNLDLLKELQVELVPFSPLEDPELPKNLSALYFGGGFPEIYARELELNSILKNQILRCVQEEMPIYAECGGLMYLSEAIETLEGTSFAMVGAVPGKIKMTDRLQNFGYKEGRMRGDTLLGAQGSQVRGHEFHYSQRLMDGNLTQNIPYELEDRKSGQQQLEGFSKGSLLASYLHLNFLTNPKWAEAFVQTADLYRQNLNGTIKRKIYNAQNERDRKHTLCYIRSGGND